MHGSATRAKQFFLFRTAASEPDLRSRLNDCNRRTSETSACRKMPSIQLFHKSEFHRRFLPCSVTTPKSHTTIYTVTWKPSLVAGTRFAKFEDVNETLRGDRTLYRSADTPWRRPSPCSASRPQRLKRRHARGVPMAFNGDARRWMQQSRVGERRAEALRTARGLCAIAEFPQSAGSRIQYPARSGCAVNQQHPAIDLFPNYIFRANPHVAHRCPRLFGLAAFKRFLTQACFPNFPRRWFLRPAWSLPELPS